MTPARFLVPYVEAVILMEIGLRSPVAAVVLAFPVIAITYLLMAGHYGSR